MKENTYYTWEAQEYEHTDTPNDWFWAVGIITLVICILAIMFKNYLFSVLIIIGMVSIAYTKIRHPKLVRISISERSIDIGEEKRYYQDIQAFWIEIIKEQDAEPRLLLAMKKNFTPLHIIKIPNEINTEDLRKKLLTHLEEKQMSEGGIYSLMEKLGF